MATIEQEVLRAATKTNVAVECLADEQSGAIRAAIVSKFTAGCDSWPNWIWEHFTDAVSRADVNGWRWIGDYRPRDEVLMLFSTRDEKAMLRFPTGQSIAPVLEECFGFEFYLTNAATDFVLCYNHHDCVIATGSACDWLEERLRSKA